MQADATGHYILWFSDVDKPYIECPIRSLVRSRVVPPKRERHPVRVPFCFRSVERVTLPSTPDRARIARWSGGRLPHFPTGPRRVGQMPAWHYSFSALRGCPCCSRHRAQARVEGFCQINRVDEDPQTHCGYIVGLGGYRRTRVKTDPLPLNHESG